MGTLKKTIWTESLAQNKLKTWFLSPNSKQYEITNLFVYNWESDYLTITKSGYVYEVEIKISRADFFNDFKHKKEKHILFEHKDLTEGFDGCPNYFYYAVPENLVKESEVPEYAGLIYLKPYGVEIIKQAPKLNSEKVNIDKLKLTDKFYWNMQTWKSRCEELSEAAETIKSLKKEIKGFNKTIMYYDNELSTLNCELDEANIKIKKLEDEIRQRNNRYSQEPVQ